MIAQHKTIKIDKATHRRLRMVAAATDSTIAQVVHDLVIMADRRRRELFRDKPKEKAS